MKRLLAYSFLAFAFCLPILVRGQTTDAKEELVNLDRRLNKAIYSSDDSAVLEELLADDWQGTTAMGEITSKAELLEQMKKAKSEAKRENPSKLEVSPTEVRVSIYGDTAVVSGSLDMKLKGKKIKPWARYVNVYMRRGGKWRAISTHDCS